MSDLYGWTGNILKVDLSQGTTHTVDSTELVWKHIGGKGLNHRLAWNEIPANADAFDAENCLLISVGPLTGTPAPSSGRAEVGGVAAQTYPPMYSHSGVGGWFGAELKFAGYDSLVITGKAASPVYLWIHDDTVEIRDAKRLWGLGTYDTQKELARIHESQVRSLAIGPAGENRSRIAVLLTDTENAAGQGGFGGVAGSKNLKAICVKGSGKVRIAHPEELLRLRKELQPQPDKNPVERWGPWPYDGHTVENVPYPRNVTSCTHSCDRHCFREFRDVPRVTRPGRRAGRWGCIGPYTIGWMHPYGTQWPLWWQGLEGGFETTELINQYGLNEWELLGGMVPWLVMSYREGVLTDKGFDALKPVNPDSTEWWARLLHMIAFCEGIGDLLAEGTSRAIDILGRAQYGETMYSGERPIPTQINLQEAWGYAGHWSGRGIQSIQPFPHWLIQALVWMTATRDPLDDTHTQARQEWLDEFVRSPYEGSKGAEIAIWNEHRSELKSSLTLCEFVFPMPHRMDAESRLYSAVTGRETTEAELDAIGERNKNMQRALLIRNYDRSREQELREIMPWFKRPDGTQAIAIDEAKFNQLVDTYHELRGWDKSTGRPTRATLERLDLKDIADALESENKLPG